MIRSCYREAASYNLRRRGCSSAVTEVLGCVHGSWGEAAHAVSWQSIRKVQSFSELMHMEQQRLVSFDMWLYCLAESPMRAIADFLFLFTSFAVE